MAWTKNGTIAATNGQVAIVGTGTTFISNKVQAGDAILLADGKLYEIASVDSQTGLTLAAVYGGSTASGMAYAIIPTNNRVGELAGLAAELLNSFVTVRDTVGLGMFADGTVGAPGVRFTNDQDTGIARSGTNQLGLVTGGVQRVAVTAAGNVGIGAASPLVRLHVNAAASTDCYAIVGNDNNGALKLGVTAAGVSQILAYSGTSLAFGKDNFGGVQTEYARFDTGGVLSLGSSATTGVHRLWNSVSPGNNTLQIDGNQGGASILCQSIDGEGYNMASAAVFVGKRNSTGRSINAGGTINASGADYAEYMTKADGCGPIAKGDVCGVDADGKLTKSWAAAMSFVVKSTDPSLVGGDIWGADLPPKPDAPVAPVEPTSAPPPSALGAEPVQPVREEDEDDDAFTQRIMAYVSEVAVYGQRFAESQAYAQAVTVYQQQLAAYQTAHGQWQADQAQYDTDLGAWEAALEEARQCVDRIAFSGQVPVNVTGDFAVGDYVIASANGGGIKAIAVPAGEISFEQYRSRVGKVWAVRDGRAWIDVQHG